MSIPFVSLSDTFDQWRSKTNANSVNVGDIVLLTTPVTSDLVSALNEVNQRLVSLDQTALKEVVEDLTPELGGNLNLNSNDIVGVGNIIIDGVISGTIVVGGDLTGTTANAQINPNSIGITELNLPDGTAGQFLKTDGIGGLSFDTVLTDSSNEVVGGDVSGIISNIEINPDVVGINELDVSDGNAGQVLSTDGSGTLSFVDGGIGAGSAADYEEDILIGDGTTTTFIFPSNTSAPSEEAILVSIDGVVQPTSSYELPVSTSIRFPNSPPDSGATIRVLHLGIVSSVSPGSSIFVEDLFAGNGTTDFTLSTSAPAKETILVYVDGVSQSTTEYSLLSPTIIRFTEAPLTNSTIRVVHLGVSGGGVADGSITTPKLADNAVTPAKLGAGVILAQTIAPNSVGIPELDVSDGSAGEFLRTNGAGLLEFAAAAGGSGGGGLTGMQVFDTPGAFTWTKPSDVKSILYFVTGGGGGVHPGGNSSAAPSGGGGGATAMGFLNVINLASETGTVGNGGSGVGTTQGGTGGTSTFGSTITALGGRGGGLIGGISNGLGGTATGGQLNMSGGVGQAHGDTSSATSFAAGGVTFFAAIGSGARGHIGGNSPGNVGNAGAVIILEFGGPEETTGSGGDSGGGNQTVSPFGPSQSGYSLGGAVTGDQHFSSRVDKFAYSSGSNATTVADMPATRGKSQTGACTSSTAAYQCAGYIRDINDNNQGDGGTLKNSDALTRVTFSSDALSFELTNLSKTQRSIAGVSSSTHGYVGGGFQDSSGSVRKFSFANETSQSNPHNMTKGRSSFFGVQSGTHGYWGGGSNAVGFAPQNDPNFEKFAFASDGSSVNVAALNPNQDSAGCLSSEFQGWFRQGTTLYELTFVSDSNSVNTLGNPPEEILRGASRTGSYFTAGEGWSHGGQSEANGVFAIIAASNKFSILSGNEASQQGDLTIARSDSTAHGF